MRADAAHLQQRTRRRIHLQRALIGLGCVLFVLHVGVIAVDARTFASDYAPLIAVPAKLKRISVYAPFNAFCRRGSSAATTVVPNQQHVREIVFMVVLESPMRLDDVESLMSLAWGDTTARRAYRFTPRSLYAQLSDPPMLPHVSPQRTIQLSENKRDRLTEITHYSRYRICPAGMQ